MVLARCMHNIALSHADGQPGCPPPGPLVHHAPSRGREYKLSQGACRLSGALQQSFVRPALKLRLLHGEAHDLLNLQGASPRNGVHRERKPRRADNARGRHQVRHLTVDISPHSAILVHHVANALKSQRRSRCSGDPESEKTLPADALQTVLRIHDQLRHRKGLIGRGFEANQVPHRRI